MLIRAGHIVGSGSKRKLGLGAEVLLSVILDKGMSTIYEMLTLQTSIVVLRPMILYREEIRVDTHLLCVIVQKPYPSGLTTSSMLDHLLSASYFMSACLSHLMVVASALCINICACGSVCLSSVAVHAGQGYRYRFPRTGSSCSDERIAARFVAIAKIQASAFHADPVRRRLGHVKTRHS
jgi:hypothetical protein